MKRSWFRYGIVLRLLKFAWMINPPKVILGLL
jgi:hypothetical protein